MKKIVKNYKIKDGGVVLERYDILDDGRVKLYSSHYADTFGLKIAKLTELEFIKESFRKRTFTMFNSWIDFIMMTTPILEVSV